MYGFLQKTDHKKSNKRFEYELEYIKPKKYDKIVSKMSD